MAKGEWRRGRDSNPRMGFTPINGLANPSSLDREQSMDAEDIDVSLNHGSNAERKERVVPLFAKAQESAQRRSEAVVYTPAEQLRRREARVRRSEIAAESGGVYFLEAVGLKIVKIGYAIRLHKRMSQLATACPVPLRLVAFIRGPQSLELDLHIKFHKTRSHGEWFRLGKRLAAFIEQNQPPAQ